jgi:hypothetical protein
VTHCGSNDLIESSSVTDFEWSTRFVPDKARISRRISATRSVPSLAALIHVDDVADLKFCLLLYFGLLEPLRRRFYQTKGIRR